ncbi:MAG: MMPL family transporter [Bacteroidota bacterium]
MFEYPVQTPFAITTIPAIHLDKPQLYEKDKTRLLQDERFVHNLISEDGKTLVLFLKTINSISLDQAEELMKALDGLIQQYEFEEYHYLGRPYFQKEMVAMQQREITISTVISGTLVTIIMFLIFRRFWGISVALFSILLGMLLFMGFLGGLGRELNAMAALYPVLMIIVGTSDVIHIMSKYIDELKKGNDKRVAIMTTIREIGLATLLTSLTTAIGFASLLTSRISPIRDFGLNAAAGVIIAYLTVVIFTTAVLSWFSTDQIVKLGKGQAFWDKLMDRAYRLTVNHPRRITIGALVFIGLNALGIAMISTNYNIISNLPRGEKITEDFVFFDNELSGFRPMEFAIFTQGDYTVRDFEVIQEMDKIETYLRQYPFIQAINSVTTVYKSLNQMNSNNRASAYKLPESEARFARYQRAIDQIPQMNVNILVNKEQNKARISSRIDDIGADSIKAFAERMDLWLAQNIDSDVIEVKRTGTGVIIDKNAEYIRRDLLMGLGFAILIVSLLMALLFRNVKMLLISLVPNLLPLLFAGALLGYLGIELEAGVSIVFAVIFGIAVDDTIHFLSKYKLTRDKGLSMEESLRITFLETGKAIALTSIILFFGFLVMLFSIHPPSVVVGLLISVTLFSALIADLLLIPLLIRKLL